MNAFDNKKYELEARERWGKTDAYKEFEHKTANHTKADFNASFDGLNEVLKKFADCKADGYFSDSAKAQSLVRELQDFITSNFYTYTNDVLKGLGQMYTADERFKANIDKHGTGTAEFISEAIEIYCK